MTPLVTHKSLIQILSNDDVLCALLETKTKISKINISEERKRISTIYMYDASTIFDTLDNMILLKVTAYMYAAIVDWLL